MDISTLRNRSSVVIQQYIRDDVHECGHSLRLVVGSTVMPLTHCSRQSLFAAIRVFTSLTDSATPDNHGVISIT
jgi:hypothetical protein